jgi:acyl-coenzyme A synthetase/AMP-(fatty) acid ligase
MQRHGSAAVLGARRCGRRLPGFDPGSYLDTLVRHRATEINLVPTMLGMLLSSGAAERADVSSLRTACKAREPDAPPGS